MVNWHSYVDKVQATSDKLYSTVLQTATLKKEIILIYTVGNKIMAIMGITQIHYTYQTI